MAVRASERSPSTLDVQMRCEELVLHTIKICSNERIFDPKYSFFTEKIIETAVGVGEKLWKANGIRVGNDFDKWDIRHNLQAEACMELDYFLYLICLARTLYHLRSGKYRYWVKLARETRDLARAWRDSDSRRYGGLKSGT